MNFCSISSSSFDILPSSSIQNSPDDTFEAVCSGDDGQLQLLLKKTPTWLQKISPEGNTLLHEAAARGFSRCVVLLCSQLEGGTQSYLNLNYKNNEGSTALHLAAQNGHNQCCREIIVHGANPNASNKYGDTPAHTACRYGHAGVVRILISAFTDLNMRNRNGDTPLHIACGMGRRKLTRILLEAQQPPPLGIRNLQNETPFEIAKRKKLTAIMVLFNSHQGEDGEATKPSHLSPSEKDESKPKHFIFSPYGCHNLLNTKPLVMANVQQLSHLKLDKGEEFYVDLAGNIKKGPRCVINTCLCKQLLNIC